MVTVLVFGVLFYIFAAAVGWIPYVESLPFDLDIGISTAAGYWYEFTHVVWFLSPVWDVVTWYFLIFLPLMMVVRLVLGNRISQNTF